MSKKMISLVLASSLVISSCSSTQKSIGLGLGTGAIAGGIIGAASSKDSKGATTGLAIGALVGGIASYFIDGGLKKRDEETRRDTLFNLDKHGVFGATDDSEKDITWKLQERMQWKQEMRDFGGRK